MRAYQAADQNGDGFLKRDEFEAFLRYIVFYNNCWNRFAVDGVHASKLGREDFGGLAQSLGIADDAEEGFDRIDNNGSGWVTYIEYCTWMARHSCQWDLSHVESAERS
eukprot:CAMPEP_0194053250 /NCGR_PEP_ID=MMETSP0009_2-20130614/48935_1 /TAXON_ID=210454 /ORGANISM="Grammatophora oceanica, Strain CCMP 410" /LENGTH=107 /DNA_ID=CAMNT_0038701227 /DNA_START=85 /DNA_END=405 /DNA_ORIENTATION=+